MCVDVANKNKSALFHVHWPINFLFPFFLNQSEIYQIFCKLIEEYPRSSSFLNKRSKEGSKGRNQERNKNKNMGDKRLGFAGMVKLSCLLWISGIYPPSSLLAVDHIFASSNIEWMHLWQIFITSFIGNPALVHCNVWLGCTPNDKFYDWLNLKWKPTKKYTMHS